MSETQAGSGSAGSTKTSERPKRELRNGKREKGGVYTQVARYSSIIFLLPSCLLVGYLIGYFLDRQFDSDPWISVAGLLLGGVAGLVRVVKMFSR